MAVMKLDQSYPTIHSFRQVRSSSVKAAASMPISARNSGMKNSARQGMIPDIISPKTVKSSSAMPLITRCTSAPSTHSLTQSISCSVTS